jgi:DMSO/TMAO reductase YedYZ molybdopterin-dependent catalytic subunit
MSKFTRGFFGGNRSGGDTRLPPGQYDAGTTWPVLSVEVTPKLALDTWTFAIDGLVEQPTTWTWDEIHAIAPSVYAGAIHCVTTWSKFDMTWTGVSIDDLLALAKPLPSAKFIMAKSTTGYTTNLPLDDVVGGKAWIAWEVDGAPLSADHGGPARMIVPHLYFWKSAKWVSGMTLMEHDQLGFWERNGYHDRGDPWLEQRYQGD